MPVPTEFMPFFTSLVDKSKKSEINWEATGQPDAYRVRFSDFSISVSQENGQPPSIRVQLLNDQGQPTVVMSIDDGDDEWLGTRTSRPTRRPAARWPAAALRLAPASRSSASR